MVQIAFAQIRILLLLAISWHGLRQLDVFLVPCEDALRLRACSCFPKSLPLLGKGGFFTFSCAAARDLRLGARAHFLKCFTIAHRFAIAGEGGFRKQVLVF